MKKPHRVEDYLEHIAQATERAMQYLEPFRTVEAFAENQQIQDAIIRNIEIIGEAVNHIHREHPLFIPAHPELPWREMRSMRNKMIHNYFDELQGCLEYSQKRPSSIEAANRYSLGRLPQAKRPQPISMPRQAACQIIGHNVGS